MIDRYPRLASLALAGAASLGLALLSGAGPATARVSPAPTAGARAPAAHGRHLIRAAHREGPARAVTNFTSNNWDGYFTTDASHDTDFTAISATWTEAAVTCSSKKEAWAGFWVGMDGWWNSSVEQGGTEAICRNGSPQYSVWWEMFPFNAIQVSFAINPGDTIHASVTYSPSSKKFNIVVKDLTSGKTLTKNIACQQGQGGCQRSSADVISEDIENSGGELFPLPDYGTQTYKSVSVTDTSGHTGPLNDSAWQLGRVTEVSSGVTKQTASGLKSGGTSFTTAWQHA
jgi:peptidase A4-like protein